MFNKKFPFFYQRDKMDCGPVCLKMLCKYYGKEYSLEYLRAICHLDKSGVSLGKLKDATDILGFNSLNARLNTVELLKVFKSPCILHWNHDHFVILIKISNNGEKFIIADPGHGKLKISKKTFTDNWLNGKDKKGVAFFIAPEEEFFQNKSDRNESKVSWKFIFDYAKDYKKHLIQLTLAVLFGNLISLLFPFLTQILVDEGVVGLNVNIVAMVIIAQIALFIGEMVIELIRSWLLLFVSTRISISIVSDFLLKIMKLPIRFYDTKSTGDINQRIQDHERIEDFLTGSSINAIFSISNILLLSLVLFFYSLKVFTIFIVISTISVFWILIFLKKRRYYDYSKFQLLKDSQDVIFELISGMQEIKLNTCEDLKKTQWEGVQINLFELHAKILNLEQYQRIGFKFINYTKNLVITYIAAVEVIDGNITLGMLLSISYIIGQANSPLDQLVPFFKSLQDTKISLERLNEIHNLKSEQESQSNSVNQGLSLEGDIQFIDVSFRYGGPRSPSVLNDINLRIPKGKITAIVGTSGSGKTTLLKLLLKFYVPTTGKILLDQNDFVVLDPEKWREKCGIVMQSGYIFSDTIENNIKMGADNNPKGLTIQQAVRVANIHKFVENLPLKYQTKLGNEGGGISMGQQQRILIARAVYKQPSYIFFDEATSALDSKNEKIIIENLNEYFKGKTVVVIAHRLSTVKHADQIVVLDSGRITEIGSHEELVQNKGDYYNLIKNQLELGN